MSDEVAEDEWTPVTSGEVWAGILVSVFGGFGLGSYRLREEVDEPERLQKILERRNRRNSPLSQRQNESLRGDIWRFKQSTSRAGHH